MREQDIKAQRAWHYFLMFAQQNWGNFPIRLGSIFPKRTGEKIASNDFLVPIYLAESAKLQTPNS